MSLPDGAPAEFRVLRAGVNKTTKGDFLFDEEAARLVMESYASRGLDKIQVDYEHQSLKAPPAGGDARKPAAGWFKPEVRGGELWAVACNWTASALAALAPEKGAPEYRYFSPVLFFDEETRRVTGLKNLALTNDPAMDDISPLMAATDTKETAMACETCTALSAKNKDLEEKCSALTAKLSAFETVDKDKKEAMSALTDHRSRLCALTGQATDAAALGVIEAWKTKAAEADALRAQAEVALSAQLETEMKTILDDASKAGKLEPAMRSFEEKAALAMGGGKISKAGIEYLSAKWTASSKKVASDATKQKETNVAVLTDADREVGAALGTDMVAFEKYKADELLKAAQRR